MHCIDISKNLLLKILESKRSWISSSEQLFSILCSHSPSSVCDFWSGIEQSLRSSCMPQLETKLVGCSCCVNWILNRLQDALFWSWTLDRNVNRFCSKWWIKWKMSWRQWRDLSSSLHLSRSADITSLKFTHWPWGSLKIQRECLRQFTAHNSVCRKIVLFNYLTNQRVLKAYWMYLKF